MSRAAVLLACYLVVSMSGVAQASEAFVRVISQAAPIHTGPGSSYREVFVAERGDVFTVLERGTKGYWFRVELEDGTTGWIFGELVFPYEVAPEEEPGFFAGAWRGFRRAVLAPSPVPYADVEISVSAGVLEGEGLFLLRPGIFLDKHLAIDGFFGLSPRAQEDLFLGGLALTLRLWPGAAAGPFISVGTGAAYLRPKADNFTDEADTLMAVNAGGGFEITFKKLITLRIDFRNWTLFDPDKASNGQEYSGGLAIYF